MEHLSRRGSPRNAISEPRGKRRTAALMAVSMGIQNSTVRRLAVPDLTTTVLSLTVVGMRADHRVAGGSGSRAGRRLTSITSMFVGALIGSFLILHYSIVYPFLIAVVIIATVATSIWTLSKRDAPWNQANWYFILHPK